MKTSSLLRFVLCIVLTVHLSLFSGDLYSFWADVSHTEGKGIGYPKGYTTVEAFMMSSVFKKCSLFPFINVRGHGFDNLKLALNIGGGVRYLTDSSWILGGNVYYDNRQGSHYGFNQVGYAFQQIGFGFEALGPCFDLRFNVYQPFGKKVWHFHQTTFNDNLGITPTITKKAQATMYGADVEIGAWLGKWDLYCIDWASYFACGPYYLDQKEHTGRWGGKCRLTTLFNRYFLFEMRYSYDHVAHGLVQVRVGIDFPLCPVISNKSSRWCNYSYYGDSLSQPVQRVDIMPLKKWTRR